MKTRLAFLVCFAAACSDDAPATTMTPPGSVELALSQCLAEGRALEPLWSVDNGHGVVHALAAGPSGAVALAGADGSIKLWHVGASAEEWAHQDFGAAYQTEFAEGAIARALAFGDGAIAAGTEGGELRLHDPESGSVMAQAGPASSPVTAVAHAPDGRIAVADDGFQGNLGLWDAAANTLIPLSRDGQDLYLWGVTTLAFAPSGSLLAAGDWYGMAALERWDDGGQTGIWVARAEDLPAFPSGHELLAAAPLTGGRVLAGGGAFLPGESSGGFLVLLDLESLAQPVAVRELDARILALAPLPDGRHVLSVAGDGTLRAFDAATLEEVARAAAPGATELALTADGAAAATSGADGILRLWGCQE